MDQLRIAVVGPGRIARAHLEAVRHNPELVELAVIVGLPQEEAHTQKLAEEFGARYGASIDFSGMLADPDIDAVVLTVPNFLHREMAIRALEAGKHVLVEKPLANTVQDADAMIEAAECSGRVLMAAQCRRFFPAALEAKRRISDLGRPLSIMHVLGVKVEAAKADWWRSASKTGGLALGLNGPHVVDTILWLVGERPVRVYAQTSRFKTGNWEGEDEATIVLTFPDGSIATGHVSFNMEPHTNERWINGPKGSMHLVHDRSLWVGATQIIEKELTAYIEGDESFDGQLREFALAIREKREPQAAARQVRPVVEVLEAALESARTNRPVEF